MKKNMNNKGFSLVELIIVIAIMAVLMGVLAPQYLKYVKQSKISTDITNAEQLATAINVAVADSTNVPVSVSVAISTGTASVAGGDAVVYNTTGTGTSAAENGVKVTAPALKTTPTDSWSITWNDVDGVTKIEVAGSEIWPTSSAYETAKNASN